MATQEQSKWEGCCKSHLNIVLLGGRNSGKSCVGNVILGKEEFVTRERTSCSRRLGVVAGRRFTVVDTPGWWCDFSAQDTAALVKREIVSSVSLCLPGPHVFLVVIKATSCFSSKRRMSLGEHLALLGERVWSHCIIVFTCAEWPLYTGAEDHIKNGGSALQWLGDKCNQRCHLFVFNSDIVGSQITELLGKIERLVAENGNKPFEMQQSILQKVLEKKRDVDEKARHRFTEMKKQRALLQGQLCHLSDIRILLVGAKGSGKTSTANTILGRERNQDSRRTARCVTGNGFVFGRNVTIVDTPGWWMNYFTDESPVFDQREMVFGSSLCPPGPHAFLLVVRADRAFTEAYRRAVQEHLELISKRIWIHVIVLLSFGDWLADTTAEQYIESEGGPLRWLVEKCGNRYHVFNNKTTGDGFQVRQLMGKVEEMVAGGNNGSHFEIERNRMQDLEEKMRTDKERANERLMRKKKQSQIARSHLEKMNSIPEVRMALLGGRNTGKSSCANTVLGEQWFNTENQTSDCAERRGAVSGRTLTVVDTPGRLAVSPDLLIPPSPCRLATALLLVVNASSSFSRSLGEAMERQLEAVGDEAWSKSMVLFSHGDCLGDTDLEERIESEGAELQRLVERCGNRYHVLDNKTWGDGAQVRHLLDLIEEMLAEQWLAILQTGAQMGKNITATQRRDGVVPQRQNIKEASQSDRHNQLYPAINKGAASANLQPQVRANGVGGQAVALKGTTRGRAAAARVTILDDGESLTALLQGLEGLRRALGGDPSRGPNLPTWCRPAAQRGQVTLHGGRRGSLLSLRHPAVVWEFFADQPEEHQATEEEEEEEEEEEVADVQSLFHPALRERTLKKLTQSGGLQAFIDQWGSSNLQELEAFIDAYFEMVWEQAMGSEDHQCPSEMPPEADAGVEQPGREALASIEKKLSKLDLLEEIQRDLAEVKRSLQTNKEHQQPRKEE